MASISTRFSRTIFLVMFLLIDFNLLRTVIPDKDGNQTVYTVTNINTSRKLLRAPLLTHIPPSPRANHPWPVYLRRPPRDSPPGNPSSHSVAPPPADS
ncbi:hypothetical protein MKW94_027236 [Papaver nudicaule]|uniref:Uncharacterized protein n=1 Tax=Papaver nudicaule TaxID=74823 RepID=A0AA42AUD7_PAPNU|nr:hypothetical protein [Papaver nudicaule]